MLAAAVSCLGAKGRDGRLILKEIELCPTVVNNEIMKKMFPADAGHGECGAQGASLAELERMIARFAPAEMRVDTAALSAGDRKALVKLIEASRVINDLFLTQMWSGNHALLMQLEKDHSALGKARLHYFRINRRARGRISTGTRRFFRACRPRNCRARISIRRI